MRRSILFLFCFMVTVGGLSSVVLAQQINVTVNGQTPATACPADGSPCPVAGTYGSVTIVDWNGTAQVVATDTSTQNSLTLQNAKISSSVNATTVDILFWKDFSDGLNAPSPNSLVRYQRTTASGSLLRTSTTAPYNPPTSAPYASFFVDGWVNGTEIPSFQSKNVLCSLAACGSIPPLTSNNLDFTQLSGTRTLKGEAKTYLPRSGDWAQVTSVQVQNIPPATTGDILERAGVCKGKECADYNPKIKDRKCYPYSGSDSLVCKEK